MNLQNPYPVPSSAASVPPLPENPSLKTNRDGWCEIILDKPKYENVIYSACAKFLRPIPRHRKPLHCIKNSSISGLGMFATTDFGIDDPIHSERPLLIRPAAIRVNKDAYDENLTEEQMIVLALQEEEKSMEQALSRMLPEAQDAYKSLANSHLEDGSGPLIGISRTNAFGITFEDGGDPYAATYNEISRINHSCLPNAAIKFERDTFCGELRPVRPIKAGEEILTSYCDIQDPLEERQKHLKKYGFTCSCPVCTSPDLEDFRARMVHSLQTLIPFLYVDMIGGIDKRDMEWVLKFSVDWIKQIEERGFQGSNAYRRHLQVAVTCYERFGDMDEAVRWVNRWCESEAVNGQDGILGAMKIMRSMAPATLRLVQAAQAR